MSDAVTTTDLRALLDAVREHLPELRERSEQAHYGYCVVEDPHDFTPDLETNTPEETANHRAACEAWDRGDRGVAPLGCGNLPRLDGWGLGGQTLRDPASSAVVALLDALLLDPTALDCLDAVTRLGAARAAKRAAQDANYAAADAYYDARSAGTGDLAALLAESLRAGRAVVPAWDAWDEANSTMCELADRLAGESK